MSSTRPSKEAVPQPASARSRNPSAAKSLSSGRWAAAQSFFGNQGVLRRLQAKLTINQPGDQYEQEADRVADRVMRMPEHGGDAARRHVLEENRTRALANENPNSDSLTQTLTPPLIAETLRSPGQPLDAATRAFMEPRFRQDLEGVRVHTDARAALSAQDLSARAYTIGNNIVFGPGGFNTNTTEGRRLLAHELTHVVQQSTGHAPARVAQRKPQTSTESGGSWAEKCPAYEAGEMEKSTQDPGILTPPVSEISPDTLLIGDFGVNWRHVKTSARGDPVLSRWLSLLDPTAVLHVTGYSDCVGVEADNLFLRSGRARKVAELLGALVGVHPHSVEAAASGKFLTSNLDRLDRAKNRGVTVTSHVTPVRRRRTLHVPHGRDLPPAPKSVDELWDLLADAQRKLENHATTVAAFDKWKPDTTGALMRIDAVIEFLRPLVDDANIARHARDDLQTTAMGLFWTRNNLEVAQRDFARLQQVRTDIAQGNERSRELDIAWHEMQFSRQEFEVLADEALSFELEQVNAAAPFRPSMRDEIPGGATLDKRELRALDWLKDQKDVILEAEQRFHVDRRAIGAVIAWEAAQNLMRAGLRGVGPGKMHTYSNKWSAVAPFLPKGEGLPQQLEERQYLPKQSDDDQRATIMTTPRGSVEYIGAAMRAATDIAAKNGFDISHNLTALTSFYQGYDLNSWEFHMKMKAAKGEKTFVGADDMAVWTAAHVTDLENAVGKPAQ